MEIKFQSAVLLVDDFEKMKSFYQDVLDQEVDMDFGNCIGFKNGLSIWKLKDSYPIAKKLGTTYHNSGNKNMELCFETDNFDELLGRLKQFDIVYLHKTEEETWGQKTIRLYDPENNLIEIGETIPCFVRRFFNSGMTIKEVSERTSVPIETVANICSKENGSS